MKPVNDTIKAARVRLGLSEDEVSRRSGVSWNEYFDLELHPTEAFEVMRLGKLKKVLKVLGLDVLESLGIPCSYCGHAATGANEHVLAPNELIRQRRADLGLSEAELGGRIGFEAVAIHDMERESGYLEERWPAELVAELASILTVPPQLLLGVKGRRCRR